jgi:hypothetical protein
VCPCSLFIVSRYRWKNWQLSPTSTSSGVSRRRTSSPSCFHLLLHRESSSDGMGYDPVLSTLISSSDDKVLNMEGDLLFGNFESDETSQEVQEHIRAMSSGKATFQAKTLGFVYRRLLAKKRKTTVHCARNLREHVYTISELLDGLYCPACHEYGRNGKGEYGRPFTRCGRCNALRDTFELRCSRCNILFQCDL